MEGHNNREVQSGKLNFALEPVHKYVHSEGKEGQASELHIAIIVVVNSVYEMTMVPRSGARITAQRR